MAEQHPDGIVVDAHLGSMCATWGSDEAAQAGPGFTGSHVPQLDCDSDRAPKNRSSTIAGSSHASEPTDYDVPSGGRRRADRPALPRQPGKVPQEVIANKTELDNIFDFNVSEGAQMFNQVLRELDYVNHGITCAYQVRRGSASNDVVAGHRTLVEVQKRGRWEVQKSVRRYSNGGRASQVYDGLPHDQKRDAARAERWMTKILGPSTEDTSSEIEELE